MMLPDNKLDAKLAVDLELVEIAAWTDFYRSAPPEVAKSLGIELHSVGRAEISIAARIDTLALNRVLGMGISERVADGAVAEVVEIYRRAGAKRLFVQPSPVASEIIPVLQRQGLTRHNNWAKLYRPIEPIPKVSCGLDIRPVARDQAVAFADIMTTSFEWDERLKPWLAAFVGRRAWNHYMAYDGSTPVATAAFFASGAYAWIDFASTLPAYRGRGAQAGLLARRLQDAAALGCRMVIVETAEETPEKSAPSYRNMVRYGFTVAYKRPNFVYKF